MDTKLSHLSFSAGTVDAAHVLTGWLCNILTILFVLLALLHKLGLCLTGLDIEMLKKFI